MAQNGVCSSLAQSIEKLMHTTQQRVLTMQKIIHTLVTSGKHL